MVFDFTEQPGNFWASIVAVSPIFTVSPTAKPVRFWPKAGSPEPCPAGSSRSFALMPDGWLPLSIVLPSMTHFLFTVTSAEDFLFTYPHSTVSPGRICSDSVCSAAPVRVTFAVVPSNRVIRHVPLANS
ncbi:Uncharacterised protein [Mycobacteroides abscessus subsp. abscessus]|nr:Uncharacterised protein [Mycobacteroides abscessus subsp. abscessus]